MKRSTKDAWLTGDGDLREEEVEDVPVPGESVLVRGLSARYSAEVQGQMKLVTESNEQVARIDVASMERLQFQHGVVDPSFGPAEVAVIQDRFGPAFKKVIAAVDRLSGIDKEAIVETEQRFPASRTEPDGGEPVQNGTASGDRRSDLPASTGA